MRVRVDENIPPAASGPQKSIHHRNKSSPALATLANASTAKANVMRTAFGDVSNTINGNRFGPAKDDLSYPVKMKSHIPEKTTLVQESQETKPAALLRPAQRPLSVTNLKSLLPSSSNAKETDTLQKQAAGNDRPTTAPVTANSRKVLTKRNTTIFKDTALPTVSEISTVPQRDLATEIAPVAPVHQSLLKKDTSTVNNGSLDVSQSQPSIRDVTVQQNSEITLKDKLPYSVEEPGLAAADEREEPQIFHDSLPVQEPQIENQHQALAVIAETNNVVTNSATAVLPRISKAMPDAAHLHYSQPPQPLETEEYWDDEDNADEDGYVTAHSYKSRGDNTTGGATTVLFPQVTKQVKRELAAAKQLVEATRTAEEIEDECYDTSMVAEYGDDIFTYMKELEVCVIKQHVSNY